MVKSKKGHNLINISRSSKVTQVTKPYAKYENPSSSGSYDIVLTRVFMTESIKGHNFAIQGPTKKKKPVRLFFVLMLHIKLQVPGSSRSLVLQPTTMLYSRLSLSRS